MNKKVRFLIIGILVLSALTGCTDFFQPTTSGRGYGCTTKESFNRKFSGFGSHASQFYGLEVNSGCFNIKEGVPYKLLNFNDTFKTGEIEIEIDSKIYKLWVSREVIQKW